MIFTKDIAYEINPTSLPRLVEEELYDISDVLVRQISEDTGVIRYSDLYHISNMKDVPILEIADEVIRHHGLSNYITIINEYKFYTNEDYRDSVLFNMPYITMQSDHSVPIDKDLYNLLEDTTEYLLNENDVMVGSNELVTDLNNQAHNSKDILDRVLDSLFGTVAKPAADIAVNAVNKKMSNKHTVDKAAQQVGNVTEKAIDNSVKVAKNRMAPMVKKTAAAAGAVALVAIARKQVKNLTSQEQMHTNNPGIISRNIKTLKMFFNKLVSRQPYAPPKQQGIISKLLSKIQSAIAYLGRKLGMMNYDYAY